MTLGHFRAYMSLEGICPDPIFVIGSPRSGTTALGHALNRHPELWASSESYVIFQLYGQQRAERVWSHHRDRANPSWLRSEDVGREEFLAFLGLGINAMHSSRSGGRRWIDATPLNTSMIDEVGAMFPGAFFIHTVRDGRLVVRSMREFRQMLERERGPVPGAEMPAWTSDFRSGCETWAAYVAAARRFERANPDRCVTVRNEELLADPGAALAPVLEFVGAAADDRPAGFLAGSRINSSFRDGDGQSGKDAPGWSEEQRRTFADVAGATMLDAGYWTDAERERWVESGD